MIYSFQIIYGMSFDLQVSERANENNANNDLYETDCWQSSALLRIENALSRDLFHTEHAQREMFNKSSYGGSDSKSWLISLGQSLLQSFILWQPLTYVSFY